MIVISVIIPVYNVGIYLSDCIDSIVNKNPKRIEVIIVNDGSTDSSGYIADCYKRKYDYIKVFHQSNQGVSAARNSALREAQGRYLVFVDADDIIYDGFFEKILHLIKEQPDIIEINAKSIGQKGVLSKDDIFSFVNAKKELNHTNHAKLMFSQQAKYYLWSRIIKRELVEDLSFDEQIGFCEDALYLTECYFRARKIVILDKPLYGYRQHTNNITKINDLHNIKQLADLTDIIKHKIITSEDTSYKGYYLSLLVNMIHLRKSMYAIDSKRIACDNITLENIKRIQMLRQPANLNEVINVTWLRRFSIFAPKVTNFLILSKVFFKNNRFFTIYK